MPRKKFATIAVKLTQSQIDRLTAIGVYKGAISRSALCRMILEDYLKSFENEHARLLPNIYAGLDANLIEIKTSANILEKKIGSKRDLRPIDYRRNKA